MGKVILFRPRQTSPGDTLRTARERAGLSHTEIAPILGTAIDWPGLSPATVRAWERGEVRPPTEVVTAAQQLVGDRAERIKDNGAAHLPGDGEALTAVMQAFRDADRRVGGGYIYGAVLRYLNHEVAPRLITGQGDIFDAAAALTEMAGWMSHDAGLDAVAQQHFNRSLQLSNTAEDFALTAHIHASLSHLALQLDQPRDALRRSQAGLALLSRQPHPAVAARLHAMRARALATLRRRAESGHALLQAEAALDGDVSESASPWVSPFDHASLAAEACSAMESIGNARAARRHAEQIIDLRNDGHVRSRSFGQLRLANILVDLGEIEHACTLARAVLDQSSGVSSGRLEQLLRSLQKSLLPHASEPETEAVLLALATSLSSRPDPLQLIVTAHQDQGRIDG